jgi:hypothetical protein
VRERVCHGGPLDGERVPRSRVRGAFAWLDGAGRAYAAPADGRTLYVVANGDRLDFAGHGARRCGGCGAMLDAGEDGGKIPACPLCGALH